MTRGKCLITESALHVKQDKLIHIKCCVVNIYVNYVQKYQRTGRKPASQFQPVSHHGYLTGWATFQILSQIIVLALKIKKTKLLFDFIFTLEQKSLFLPAYKNQRVLCIKYLFCPLDVSYGPVHHGHTAARLFVANDNKTESRTS